MMSYFFYVSYEWVNQDCGGFGSIRMRSDKEHLTMALIAGFREWIEINLKKESVVILNIIPLSDTE